MYLVMILLLVKQEQLQQKDNNNNELNWMGNEGDITIQQLI